MRGSAQEPCVVLVDDEEMVGGALRGFLQLETSYQVRTFTSPLAALEAIREEPVNVVIADFMMPEMDGITMLRQVRDEHPSITRILLTGYADKQNAIRAINEVGLYQYVEKPWSNDQLKLLLHNAIERSVLLNELDSRVSALEAANQDLFDLRRRLIQAFL